MSRSISTMDKTIYMLESKVQRLENAFDQLGKSKLDLEDSMQAEIERQFHYFCTERNELKAEIERLDELTGYQMGQLLGLQHDHSGLVDINEKLKIQLERVRGASQNQILIIEGLSSENDQLKEVCKLNTQKLTDAFIEKSKLKAELEQAKAEFTDLNELYNEKHIECNRLTQELKRANTSLLDMTMDRDRFKKRHAEQKEQADELELTAESYRSKLAKFADQLEERGAYLVEDGFEEPFECAMLREARAALKGDEK